MNMKRILGKALYALIGKHMPLSDSKISLGMQRMGYNMPDITSYINSVIDKLDSYIDNRCLH